MLFENLAEIDQICLNPWVLNDILKVIVKITPLSEDGRILTPIHYLEN